MTLTPPHEYSYFFSVFGVALTHLVLEDDDYHHKGITPSRDSDDVLNAKALAAEGAAGRNSPPPPGNARQRAEAQKYPNTLESLEVLRAVNERVAAASSVADVWGQGAILWGLTNSSSVTVDMLRQTQIGRTVGQFTKRNCAKVTVWVWGWW